VLARSFRQFLGSISTRFSAWKMKKAKAKRDSRLGVNSLLVTLDAERN
jgi:hypothetical protein